MQKKPRPHHPSTFYPSTSVSQTPESSYGTPVLVQQDGRILEHAA
jgi:hypothetical protein